LNYSLAGCTLILATYQLIAYNKPVDNIQIPVNLYSVSQALTFLEGLGLKMSDTWLRKRMEAGNLDIYRVGKTEFVTETDLYRLSLLPRTKPGPRKKKGRE